MYVGLFLISLATLLLELLHTRILSFMLWSSLVYMVVTIAMLGFGISGTFLCFFSDRLVKNVERWSAVLALLFALSSVIGIAIIGRAPIPAFRLNESPVYVVRLVLFYVVLTAPFFLAGACIGLALMARTDRAARLYFANLLGSAAGCIVYVPLIESVGAEPALLLSAVVACMAGAAFSYRKHLRLAVAVCAIGLVALVAGVVAPTKLLTLRCDPDKVLGRYTEHGTDKHGTIELTRWSAISRTDVISAPDAGGELPDGVWISYKIATADADSWTAIVEGLTDERMQEMAAYNSYRHDPRGLPYVIQDEPDVLVIGAGGGIGVVRAVVNGARSIVAVDINRTTLDLVRNEYKEYTKGLYLRPEVEVVADEGRSFVRRCNRQFDVIQLHGVDTFAALASGSYVMAENYLYTVEACRDYLEHLTENGILVFTRMSFSPPRETMKVCTALVEAMRQLEVEAPWRHVIVLGNSDSDWANVLVKRTPYTQDDLRAYKGIIAELGYKPYYVPGEPAPVEPPDNTRFYFFPAFFKSDREDMLQEFYRSYPYDITPPTDNKPFFYKTRRIREYLAGRRVVEASGYEHNLGFLSLAVLLVETVVASLVLILLPLLKFRREALRGAHAPSYITYFFCLGLGFIAIELQLMQRFALFLGHPVYSISVVLFTILLFAGAGSLLSEKLRLSHGTVALMTLCIATLSLVYIFVSPLLFRTFLGWSTPLRVTVSVLYLAPLSFMMGMPFPTGLRLLKQVDASIIPWAWGANGTASVVGAVLSVFVAMSFGFNVVLASATLAYVLCGAIMGVRSRAITLGTG